MIVWSFSKINILDFCFAKMIVSQGKVDHGQLVFIIPFQTYQHNSVLNRSLIPLDPRQLIIYWQCNTNSCTGIALFITENHLWEWNKASGNSRQKSSRSSNRWVECRGSKMLLPYFLKFRPRWTFTFLRGYLKVFYCSNCFSCQSNL